MAKCIPWDKGKKMIQVLKERDLNFKTCLETFKANQFSLKTFLSAREECLKSLLHENENDFVGIVSRVLREWFGQFLRQALILFNNKESEMVILEFSCRNLLKITGKLRKLLKESPADRSELTQMWHMTVLAGEALKPFSADFSIVLNDIFVFKMAKMIKKDFETRIKAIETIDFNQESIRIGESYDLNTTIALNSIVDVVNQVRLCPNSPELKKEIIELIENVQIYPENFKLFARTQF